MIINGFIQPNFRSIKKNSSYNNNDIVLGLNNRLIYKLCNNKWIVVKLSPYITYRFLDIYTKKFYIQNRKTGNWNVNNHLNIIDDDGKFLYTVKHGKIINKDRLITQYTTNTTTANLNDVDVIVSLLTTFDKAILSPNTQINMSPLSNMGSLIQRQRKGMTAIVNNSQFGISTVLEYFYYPCNDPNYNKISVSNVISKSDLNVPFTTPAVLEFTKDFVIKDSGLITDIVPTYLSGEKWIRSYITDNIIYYEFPEAGTYNVTMTFDGLRSNMKLDKNVRVVGSVSTYGNLKIRETVFSLIYPAHTTEPRRFAGTYTGNYVKQYLHFILDFYEDDILIPWLLVKFRFNIFDTINLFVIKKI
jgi:hypothetical protein